MPAEPEPQVTVIRLVVICNGCGREQGTIAADVEDDWITQDCQILCLDCRADRLQVIAGRGQFARVVEAALEVPLPCREPVMTGYSRFGVGIYSECNQCPECRLRALLDPYRPEAAQPTTD